MRGKQALFDKLIPSSLPEKLGEKSHRNTLLDERDDALATRYYYHAHLCRKRYDDCIADLSDEFFITPNVIIQRLALRVEFVKEMVRENKTPSDLRKMYGHFNWAVMAKA